jgi:hypothetical protein
MLDYIQDYEDKIEVIYSYIYSKIYMEFLYPCNKYYNSTILKKIQPIYIKNNYIYGIDPKTKSVKGFCIKFITFKEFLMPIQEEDY